MNLKAIILDIDGTLNTSEKIISPRTREALIKAQKQGIKVVLASGRPIRGMTKYIHELEMDTHHGLLVGYNGATVVDCETQSLLFNQAMSIDEAQAVLRHLKNFDLIPMVAIDDTMYVYNAYSKIHYRDKEIMIVEYEAHGNTYRVCETDDLVKLIKNPLNKILIAAEPEYLAKHAEAIAEPFKDQLSSMFTAAFYYEFTAQNIDKGNALHQTLVPLGIKPEETMAFGDGQNDISILKFAGHGVAMGNAVDELKAIADEVTASNDEDGIALVLEHYLK